jgi:valyl-tRNA synthetase
MTAHVDGADAALQARIADNLPMLDRVGRLQAVAFTPAPDGASAQIVVEGATFTLPLDGVIDIAAEKARLTKAMDAVSKEAASLNGRLSNPAFTEKAKPEAVEKARADMAEKSAEMERLTAALARLG